MDALFQAFQNPILLIIYQVVRAIGVVLDIFFLAILVYACIKLVHYRPKFVYDPRKWQKYVKAAKKAATVQSPVVLAAWKKVQARLKDGSPESMRLAVIEADGVVDEVLKRIGLTGETFADRLGRVNTERYPSVEAVWDAHRLRNNLVHTPDFHLGASKAEAAIRAYETFLKEMKAL